MNYLFRSSLFANTGRTDLPLPKTKGEGRAFAARKRLRPRRRGEISPKNFRALKPLNLVGTPRRGVRSGHRVHGEGERNAQITNRFRHSQRFVEILCLLWFAFHPGLLMACSACYGQSDSALAKGMNWGIVSLLGVVVAVLGGISSFFFVMARRASHTSKPPASIHNQSPTPSHQ